MDIAELGRNRPSPQQTDETQITRFCFAKSASKILYSTLIYKNPNNHFRTLEGQESIKLSVVDVH